MGIFEEAKRIFYSKKSKISSRIHWQYIFMWTSSESDLQQLVFTINEVRPSIIFDSNS